MSLLITVLGLLMAVQSGSAQLDVSFFVGTWTTSSTSGPTYFTIESGEGQVLVTLDRLRKPLEAIVYLPPHVTSAEARALVAHGPDRMFIIRREEDGAVLDMFSTFSDRPPVYWSERFTRRR